MEISSAQFTENGSFEKTEDLLRGGMAPQTVMTNQIINGSLQKQTEQADAFRLTVAHELGMGLQINTQV